MKRRRSLLLFLARGCMLATFLLAWTGVAGVQAHAMLIRSLPAANATLDSSPLQVELFFSETIAAQLSKISVMDSGGKQVDTGDSHLDPADPTHLLVSLPPLVDGVYMVVWNAISATDGHQTTGSFPFAVGKVNAGAMTSLAGSSMATPPPPPLGDMILKGLMYAAAAALMGGIIFTALAWDPSTRQAQIPPEDAQPYVRFSQKLALAALITLAVADILSLMVQAGQSGSSWFAWPWQPEFIALVFGTRVGLLGIARFVLAIILAALLLPPRNRWNHWVALGFCLALLLTFSLESHAAGGPHPFLPVLSDWIHMIGVSVWVGGLFSFLGGMWLIRSLAPEARTRLTSILIPHFTVLAFTSVAAVLFTGVYASFLHVGTLDALLHTPYGQALLLKLLIVAPMLAMGGINFMFTTPLMRRAAEKPGGDPRMVSRFRSLLTVETLLGVAILIWVGVFTMLPPAKVSAAATGIEMTTKVDDLRVMLVIDPGQPGINTFTAAITAGGKPLTDAQDVSLEFNSLSGMVPSSKAAMTNLGNGNYTLQGGYLGMPDNWDVKVVVTRPGKFDTYADFKVDMRPPGGQSMP
jgi:copper transport protein